MSGGNVDDVDRVRRELKRPNRARTQACDRLPPQSPLPPGNHTYFPAAILTPPSSRAARPPQVRRDAEAGEGGVRRRLQGDQQEEQGDGRPQEDLRRLPERHRRAAHVPRDHVPAGADGAREHHPAAERAEGGERQGHLPRLRLHGDRPPRRHPRQHPRAGAQAVHRVPVPQGAALLPLRRADPPRPQAVEPAAQRGVPAEGRRLRPRALPPRHREGRRERERAPRKFGGIFGAAILCAQFSLRAQVSLRAIR